MNVKPLFLVAVLMCTTPAWSQLVVNEVMTANLDVCIDPSWNYGGWIELYNTGPEDVSLQGYYISDDPTDLLQYCLPSAAGTIPAGNFGCIWFDHYDPYLSPTQVPFKMDAEGGTLYLSNAQGKQVLSIDYPAAMPRCSWARTVDVTGKWAWTANPTPAASNVTSVFAEKQAEAPVILTKSQLFDGTVSVSLSWPEEYTIRYTTDGTIPTEENGTTLNPHSMVVSQTTVFRFRAFCKGMLPSQVVTRSYILREHDYKLPVLSIVADPEELWGSEHGLFGKGPNGLPGRGEDEPCNWNRDWERAANVELIDPVSGMLFNQEADMGPSGGYSRGWGSTPFKLIASDLYGTENFFTYTLFPEKPFLRNKSFRARNGGNDWFDRYRDAALQMIVGRSGVNIDYQEYQPVQHYINGEYKGVINLREPANKHFVRANHGWDDEEIDMFEIHPDSGYIQMNGDREAFDRWCELATRCGKDEAAYDELVETVDVEEMAYYLAMEFYLANGDWPFNNVKAFRPRVEGGKWRFVVYDLDGCLSITDVFNHFAKYNKKAYPVVQLTLDMLKDQRFRQLFVDAFCVMAGSVFEPTRCGAIADEINDLTWNEIHYEGKSPSYSYNLVKSSLTAQRQTSMVDEMCAYLGITDLPQTTLNVDRVVIGSTTVEGCGRLLYNDLPIPTSQLSGKVVAPVTLRAEPASNYEFLGWKMGSNVVDKTPLHKGDSWRYYDDGSLDDTSWTAADYDDQSWKVGNAPLGYNAANTDIVTRLNYGSKDNRRPTYYMRTKVTIYNPEKAQFTLNYLSDDGFILYINGREALRYRMPAGATTYSTLAASKSLGNPDKNKTIIDASFFVPGENILAVELHNYKATDDDVYWDAALTTQYHYSDDDLILSREPAYTLPEVAKVDIQALFGKNETAQQNPMALRINEVSASNDIYVNDYWKRNDWIEVYNTSNTAVDMAGMYLSDNLSNPQKYQIPASTVPDTWVPAHGYRVIWCDKLNPLSQLHAGFKLAADSGCVVLTHSAGVLADTLCYSRQDRDMTVGRYPDGADHVYKMNHPTIGAANTLTLCDIIQPQHEAVHTSYDPLNDTEPTVIAAQYITLSGMIVSGDPAPGIYIYREVLSDGSIRVKKIYKR